MRKQNETGRSTEYAKITFAMQLLRFVKGPKSWTPTIWLCAGIVAAAILLAATVQTRKVSAQTAQDCRNCQNTCTTRRKGCVITACQRNFGNADPSTGACLSVPKEGQQGYLKDLKACESQAKACSDAYQKGACSN